jgi:hypothetical protein
VENPVAPSFKSYPDPEGVFSIACPFCGHRNNLVSQGNMPPGRRLIVRCKCGHEFEASLEARKHGRENVRLTGQYTNMTSGRSGSMIIENLSMEGIGFRDTLADHFNVGDLVVVAFELDGSNKPRVGAKVAVRQKHGQVVGCEILKIIEGAAEYGLYLLP